jgi:hypothetical protein
VRALRARLGTVRYRSDPGISEHLGNTERMTSHPAKDEPEKERHGCATGKKTHTARYLGPHPVELSIVRPWLTTRLRSWSSAKTGRSYT